MGEIVDSIQSGRDAFGEYNSLAGLGAQVVVLLEAHVVHFDDVGAVVAPEFVVLQVVRVQGGVHGVGIGSRPVARVLPNLEPTPLLLVHPLLPVVALHHLEIFSLLARVTHPI